MTALVINSQESLQGEVWKDIPGLEGQYQASTFGRIRSLPRAGKTCYGATRQLPGKLIALRAGKRGYVRIPPKIGDTQLVHRLVARTFIPNPDGLPFINHIDGNKANNRVENLEWCTHQQNMRHAFDTGLTPRQKPAKGEKSIAAKLTEEQVREIKRRMRAGHRNIDIAADYPVSKSAICEIRAGRSWGHVE